MKGRIVLLIGAILILATRLPVLTTGLWSVDEAGNCVFANALLGGGVPYRDIVDIKFPLAFHLYALVFAVFGSNNILALRCVHVVLIVLLTWGIYRLGRSACDRTAGAAAALLFAVFSWVGPPADMWALHTEWFMIAFLVPAFLLFLKGRNGGRTVHYYGSGMLFGLAVLCKQSAVFDLAAAAVFLAAQDLRHARARGETARKIVWMALGLSVPLLTCFSYLAARGAWGDFVAYTVSYHMQYYVPAVKWADKFPIFFNGLVRFFADKIVLLMCALLGFVFLFRVEKDQGREGDNIRLIVFWCLGSLLSIFISARSFQHHFIQFLPPVCLLAGWGVASLVRVGRGRALAWRLCGSGVVLAGLVYPVSQMSPYILHPPADQFAWSRNVARFIEQRSSPQDRILVWGFAPEIGVFADRALATRFPCSNFLTGMIPWVNADWATDTDNTVAPGAWAAFMEDLRRHRPKFIIDTSPVNLMGYGKYPIRRYPLLQQFLDEFYVLDPRYPDNARPIQIKIYVRRSTGEQK